MPTPSTYRDWHVFVDAEYDSDVLTRYSINFYRHSGGWYDHIRHDSHERKKGKQVLAPHFHLKVRGAFKASEDNAIEEIKEIIDNYLQEIEGVIKR